MSTEDPVLIERDRELRITDGAIRSCLQRNGQLLVVEGPSGHGKTTVLTSLRDSATRKGFTVLQARSIEFESGFSYGVVRQLFEGWLTSVTEEERRRVFRGPARLAAPLFDYGAQDPLGDETESQHSHLYGLYWLCAHIAELRPVALLIDDIRWVDQPSLRFLHYLTARLDDRPLLLAISTDPAERGRQAEITRAIVAHPAAHLLRLEPLSETAVRGYLAETLGDSAATRYAPACYASTGGIPFLLRELVDEIGTARLDRPDLPASAVADLAPPKVVRRVLRQLSGLQPTATALVEAVAVLGTEADLKHAIDVAGLDQSAVPEALGALADVGLLASDLPPRIVHPVARTAIYQNLPLSARNQGHTRAARVLAEAAAPIAEIADHLLRAPVGGNSEAVAVLRKAAQRAVGDRRDTVAVGYLRRALQESLTPRERAEVLVDLGRAELRGHQPEALDHLYQAMELSDDPTARRKVGLELVAALAVTARNEDAAPLLELLRKEVDEDDVALTNMLDAALLSTAQPTPDLRPLAQLQLRSLGGSAAVDPGLRQLLTAEQALEALRQGEPVIDVLSTVEEMIKGAFSEGVRLHLHDLGAHAWCLVAFVLVQCDRLAEADRLLTLVLEEVSARGMSLVVDATYCLRSWVRLQTGRLSEAESDARNVLDRITHANVAGSVTAFAVSALAETLIARQELTAARALLHQYECHEPGKHTLLYSPFLFAQGRLHAALGDQDAAVEAFVQGRKLLEAHQLAHPALAYASEAAVVLGRAGRTAEAAELVDARLLQAREFGAPRVIGGALRVAGLTTPEQRGVELLEEAADILERTGARLDHIGTLLDLGAAQRTAGRLSQARDTLTRGMELARACGAWALVKGARAELSAMGVRVRVTEATGVDGLTSQERRVAQLATEGKSNRDISHALFVTIKTVEWHLNRAYRKLGITSREELKGVLAGEHGGARCCASCRAR
ncbi:LuxR family transcriptional regulator [Streptomyces sp. AJS327]|uniref:helix-turn-helix transcriptional regulator n=1 Tax=Streptomyces sp. AJS327 TaxID=2545265 RepID=UPI0015DD6D6F|nr:LuxR family transcriptional regulator [Streptomyces sp. AJS327]MBA0050628.1 LuxR family transcriptional regulator [Streptomyces sp. AJS327]